MLGLRSGPGARRRVSRLGNGDLAYFLRHRSVIGDDPINVMAGLVPAIHVFSSHERCKTWMPGTRPGMTNDGPVRDNLARWSGRADFEDVAVVAGLERDSKLTAAIEFCHHGHHGDHRAAPGVVERGLYAWLLAEPDQVACGRKRQLEPPALAAFERLARRYPDRIRGLLAVVGADLFRRRRREEEPGVEPVRHALRCDPVRIGHQLVERQQHSALGKNLQEGGLALAQGGAAGGFDLAGALCIDQRLRSLWTGQQDAAFLEGFADRRDPEA